MKKAYSNAEELRKDFIKNGWSENIRFYKIRTKKANKTLFMMDNGNLYNTNGGIYSYNIPAAGFEDAGKKIPELTGLYYLDDFEFIK